MKSSKIKIKPVNLAYTHFKLTKTKSNSMRSF